MTPQGHRVIHNILEKEKKTQFYKKIAKILYQLQLLIELVLFT